MKRIYSSHDPVICAQLKILLESNHIPCIVRNDFLAGAAGELPPTECWPEIWVLENSLSRRARELIEAFVSRPTGEHPDWRCRGCGEILEGQFSECWQCGSQRPPGI